LAGWLNEFYGWRAMFGLLGLPGLALAALAWTTLREPRRKGSNLMVAEHSGSAFPPGALPSAQPTLKEVWIVLWANRTFRHLLICFSVTSFFGSGIAQWQPAFFVRSYGLKTGELGSWFTLIYGLGGVLGIYLSPNRYVAFGLMALATVAAATAAGPMFSTIQTLIPSRMRATSIALMYLFANLIGLGLGPLATGALSDAFRPWAGEESLRYALLALGPGYLWGAWHSWQASKTVSEDIEAVQVDRNRNTVETSLVLDASSKITAVL